jgi:hypothetical protein
MRLFSRHQRMMSHDKENSIGTESFQAIEADFVLEPGCSLGMVLSTSNVITKIE